jgi:hypothetical protein
VQPVEPRLLQSSKSKRQRCTIDSRNQPGTLQTPVCQRTQLMLCCRMHIVAGSVALWSMLQLAKCRHQYYVCALRMLITPQLPPPSCWRFSPGSAPGMASRGSPA